jgi:two-component system LytT family sensor kinase
MKLSARQWLIYFLAWIPYGFSYVAVFLTQGAASVWLAFTTMLCNVPAAALLGVGLIFFFGKFDWRHHQRWYFLPAHVVSALTFSFLWYGLVLLFLSIYSTIQRGVWTPNWFSGYALQWQIFSGVMIYATMACIIYLLQAADNLRIETERARSAETRAAQIEALYAQSQLTALRAQLNPHFLFNTLHSLMALTRYEPKKAEIALEKLSEMLRYVLQDRKSEQNNLIRLEDEWRFIENYLELEKMRLGDRLAVTSEIDLDALDCLIPAFTLQPLIENAVKHGISPHNRTGTIRVKAKKNEAGLKLEVSDDGPAKAARNASESNGLGLSLVRQQLETSYRGKAKFSAENKADDGFSVVIEIPPETKNAADTHSDNRR